MNYFNFAIPDPDVEPIEVAEPVSDPNLARKMDAADLVRIWTEQKARIERAFAEIVAAEETLGQYFSEDPTENDNPRLRYFDVRIRQHRIDFTDPDGALKDLRHQVWDRVIDQLGVRQMLSVKAASDLDRQISDQLMPEITLDTMRDLAASYRSNIAELHAEAVREVFDFLRPDKRWDRYKTNHKNEWRLGGKVILSRWVDTGWGAGDGFRMAYHRDAQATALENVFRSLDGKGQIQKSYYSELHAAIKESSDGTGETDYFAFRCFRNGNLHLRFKRMDLVARLNQIAGGNRLQGDRS